MPGRHFSNDPGRQVSQRQSGPCPNVWLRFPRGFARGPRPPALCGVGSSPQVALTMRRDGHIQDFESRIYRHDGSVIWISENARAVHDELAGELLYYEGMVQDITRRKSAEEARKQPKKALFATQRSCALRMRSSKQTSEWRVTFNRCFSPKRIRAFRLA